MANDIISPQEVTDVFHALGYYDGNAFTSLTDPYCVKVAKLYQGDMGLSPDGSIGPNTTRSMRAHQTQLAKMPSDFKFAFRWKLTGYFEPCEEDYPDTMSEIPLYHQSGIMYDNVPWKFFADLALEGSARRKDGTLLNTSSTYIRPTYGDYSPVIAYAKQNNWLPNRPGLAGLSLDASGNVVGVMSADIVPASQAGPWGFGEIQGRPFHPGRTMATDTGQELYSEPMFKGKGGLLPRGTDSIFIDFIGRTWWDGSIHDGHVLAVDTGGDINGAHSDLFCGGAHAYAQTMKTMPSRAHIWWSGCESRIPYGYDYCLYKNPNE